MSLHIKRIYEPAASEDGFRVLVDRLWPRGITKEKANLGLWLKDVAPSDALRRRVHGGEVAWDDFVTAYHAELEQEPARSAALSLVARVRAEPVTLLFAAKEEARNNATVLGAWIEARVKERA